MRLSPALLTALSLASWASAQDNEFPEYAATTYTSRSFLPGSSRGEILMRQSVNANDPLVTLTRANDEYRGVLQTLDPSTGAIVEGFTGWYVFAQDQRGVTPESYEICVIDDDGTGKPGTVNSIHDIVRIDHLALPPSTSTGAVSWGLSGSFGLSPVTLSSVGRDNIYYGVLVDVAPAWTADGMSVHGAWTLIGSMGDNVGTHAPVPVYTIDRTAGGVVAQPPSHRLHRMHLRGPGALMFPGQDVDPAFQRGPNPNFGGGGIYPDQTARRDGLAFRIEDVNTPLAPVVIVGNVGASAFGPAFSIPGIEGNVFLSTSGTLVTFDSGMTSPTGQLDVLTCAFPIPVDWAGSAIPLQAFLMDTSAPSGPVVRATNATRVIPE